MEITREIAAKVLETIDAGLVSGVGEPIPGQMCVEAAVCYALGLPHGDDPGCVDEALRSHKITLNDKGWSSETTRAAGLRRLGLAQLGSAGVLDRADFLARLVKMTIGKAVPRALRSAARHTTTHNAAALEAAAVLCEQEPTRASAQSAGVAAYTAAAYAAHATATAAADAAAYAATATAAAADATAAAAYATAAAAATAYAAAATAYAAAADATVAAAAATSAVAYDKSLATYCEDVVQILIEMGAPGCVWLDLAPLA